MDDEKVSKQKLLKSEIIDNSYDQSEFIEFCMQKKKDGDDLDNWSYEELKIIIKEFTSKINHEYLKENKNNEMSNKTEENNNEIILNKTQEENDNDNNNDNEIIKNENDKENEEYMIKIYCKELKKNILNDKKISVSINKCSLVKSNNLILNNSYIIYDITTSNKEKDPKDKINYKVQRRYSDFIQLRETLSKFYPYNYIPSLPEKSPEYLSKEENGTKLLPYLNIFINAIISQEEFKAFEATFLFLTLTDYDLYKNKLKEINTNQTPLNVNELKDFNKNKIFSYINEANYDNDVSILENKDELYFNNIKNYFEIHLNLISQLKSHLKEFNKIFENCTKIFDSIEQDFSFLLQLNKKVMMKEKVEKSFEKMGLFFKGWKELINKQNILVKKNINSFYKFCLNEGQEYLHLIKKRENIKNLYINEYRKLDNKKEKVWKYEDIKKWGINYEKNKNFEIDNVRLIKDKKYAKKIMLYKESQELELIKNNFGYINHMNKIGLDYYLDIYLNGFKNFIMNFVKEFYPTLNDFILYWSDLSIFVN